MKIWEYLRLDIDDIYDSDSTGAKLDELGAQGWEMFAVDPNGMAYFKRDATELKRGKVGPTRSKDELLLEGGSG